MSDRSQSAKTGAGKRHVVGQRMYWPVIGVIVGVRYADDPQNQSRLSLDAATGAMIEASVLVIDDGTDGQWMIPRCAIARSAMSDYHNYAEDSIVSPRDLTSGEPFAFDAQSPSPVLIDGDFCLVQFIGGCVDKAVITARWPHPLNNRDPSTAGREDIGTLDQRGRWVRRINGLTLVISRDGDTWIDANTCGRTLNPQTLALDVDRPAIGGLITLNGKPGKPFTLDFNPPPLQDRTKPWMPQPNPPTQPDGQRGTENTVVTVDESNAVVTAGQKGALYSRGGDDCVDVGGTPEDPPTLHATLAEPLAAAFDTNAGTLAALILSLNEVRAALMMAPFVGTTSEFPEAAQSAVVKVA